MYTGQSPEPCGPFSPAPGKVCGKDIGDHCGGKRIVWAADPDRGRQKEDQPSAEGVRAGRWWGGGDGEGQGHAGQHRSAHHCPPSEQES